MGKGYSAFYPTDELFCAPAVFLKGERLRLIVLRKKKRSIQEMVTDCMYLRSINFPADAPSIALPWRRGRRPRRRCRQRPPVSDIDARPTTSTCASSCTKSVVHHGFWVRKAATVDSLPLFCGLVEDGMVPVNRFQCWCFATCHDPSLGLWCWVVHVPGSVRVFAVVVLAQCARRFVFASLSVVWATADSAHIRVGSSCR